MAAVSANAPPKVIARSCLSCRSRKTRCDNERPRCSVCIHQNRECIYRLEAPRKRPTFAQIEKLQAENAKFKAFISFLKQSSTLVRTKLLEETSINGGQVSVPDWSGTKDEPNPSKETPSSLQPPSVTPRSTCDSSDDENDVAPFVSLDDTGNPSTFGLSSAFHCPASNEQALSRLPHPVTPDYASHGLVANAALQRQREYSIAQLPDIDGVPTELAMHLLDLHWTRQHHTFLLTYRPAIMANLLQENGPYCSKFLLNAIFACSSKFSRRLEVRDDPGDPMTTGRRFFQRCDELLAQYSLLLLPSVPTVIGLLLLGSTYNARGETSKGWLFTGYALRMVYDLGLHIDPKGAKYTPEDIEIRRRVFWGAFICDKLQSLYLGRPVGIGLRDCHVSRSFLDIYEEEELYFPYVDPTFPPTAAPSNPPRLPSPIYSVTTFQSFCLLSRIMTKIINRLYVVGAKLSRAHESLQVIDNMLQAWKKNLPEKIDYEPTFALSQDEGVPVRYPPPNVLNLHGIYYSLIILLHRPFIADGHLRSTGTPASSWKRCTTAARFITSIALAYKAAYRLEAAPYLLSYALYVACTIHVRNAAADTNSASQEYSFLMESLQCLDDISQANPGVSTPANIIRRLMAATRLNRMDTGTQNTSSINFHLSSIDLDAILNMFPSKEPNDALNNSSNINTMNMFEPYVAVDPLFGLMNAQLCTPSDAADLAFLDGSNTIPDA